MSLSASVCTALAALSAYFWIASRKAADLVEPAAHLLEAAGRLRCDCDCADTVVLQPTTDLQSLALSFIGGFLACVALVWRCRRGSVPAVVEALTVTEAVQDIETELVVFPPIEHVEPRLSGKRRNVLGMFDLS